MPNHKIQNLYADIPQSEKNLVDAWIHNKVFNYFFRECLVGERGARSAMIGQFFQRFYEACVADGIRGPWDPEVESRVNEVLQRMNFKSTKRKPKKGVAP